MKRLKLANSGRRDPSAAYRQLWRMVDGAVLDALKMHPDYMADRRLHAARRSICKRVCGTIMGYASEREKSFAGRPAESRSGAEPAATAAGVSDASERQPPCGTVSLQEAPVDKRWCWPRAVQGVLGLFLVKRGN